jgi:hypothetical protein
MIEEHVRRPREPVIDNAIGEADLAAADIRLNPARKPKVLTENGRLSHLAFSPQDATVPFPPLTVANKSRGDRAYTAVETMSDRLLAGIVVGVGRGLFGPQDMIEAASQEETGEGARPSEPLLPLIFVQAGMAETTWRIPADRVTLEFAVGDVESAIDKNRET